MKRALITFFLPIFASFLILGCDSAGTSSDSSENAEQDRASEVENLTGKELYQGFLFGDGKVASALPEIYDRPETLAGQTLKAVDRQVQSMDREEIREAYQKAQKLNPEKRRRALATDLTDRIEQSKPEFFRQFERRIKSGNPMKVKKALTSMSEVTVPALAKVLGVSETSLLDEKKIRRGDGDGKCVIDNGIAVTYVQNVDYNYSVVRLVDTVLQVDTNIDLTVVLPLPPVTGTTQAKGSGLNQEMLTARVAERFASR